MAQTKKKRRRKHRGNQAGIVERPHHRAGGAKSAKPASRQEAREMARQRRAERFDKPPTWRGAMVRAGIAALVFAVLVIVLFDEKLPTALTLAAFTFVMYIPMSYLTDRMLFNRRQKQKAAGSGR